MRVSAFGAQLRRHRESAGLSQEELAERAGLTAKAIGALERGERRRPYPHTVQLLADALALDESSRRALISAVPRSSPSAVAHGVSFVGREAELATLRASLTRVLAGAGGVITLVGEAGIGKTSIAREFGAAAQAEGAALLWGRCFEGDSQPPYGPWVEAIGHYSAALDTERLRNEFGLGAASIARLVPDLQARLSDLPDPTPLDPDAERLRLYDAISRFLLDVAASQPVLLVLDDLHWADLDSLRLLRHVARFAGQGRLLIIGVYRSPEVGLTAEHPLHGVLANLRRDIHYEQIDVGGFGREEMAVYLANQAGQELSDRLLRLVEQETGGNPFYAGEIVRHLAEAQLPRRGGDGSSEVSLEVLDIPEGVRQVVGHRVALLSPETGQMLRLAAAFEGRFGFDVLERLTETSEDALLDCLDEALEAGLIRIASSVPPTYEFAHAIVRDALYDELNPDRRIRLHRRVAVAMEQTYSGHELAHAAEIAGQYHASAGVTGAEHGLRYALAVAWQAKAAFAHERAVTFLRTARDLSTEATPAERADILRRLALAEADVLRLDEARESGELALEAMHLADTEPRASAEFLAALARALKDNGASPALWVPLVDRGLALVGDKRDIEWARLELLRDNYAPIRSGPVRMGLWLGRNPEAIAIAHAVGDEDDYARSLEPLDSRTRAETDAVLALVRTWSRPVAIIRGLEVVGRDLIYRHGAFREARKVHEELLEASERFGSLEARAEALSQIGVSQGSTGDLAGLCESLSRAQEVVSRLGPSHRLRHVFTGLEIQLAYYLEGDWELLGNAARTYATADESQQATLGLIAACYAAICAARAGNAAMARTWIEHVALASEAIPITTYAQSWVMAEAATAVWEIESAEHATRYARLLRGLMQAGLGDPGTFGPLDLSLARMVTLQRDINEAQEHFAIAHRKLEALGHIAGQAIADFDLVSALGRSSRPDRSRIVTLLDQASATFYAHGMLGWAGRASERKASFDSGYRAVRATRRRDG